LAAWQFWYRTRGPSVGEAGNFCLDGEVRSAGEITVSSDRLHCYARCSQRSFSVFRPFLCVPRNCFRAWPRRLIVFQMRLLSRMHVPRFRWQPRWQLTLATASRACTYLSANCCPLGADKTCLLVHGFFLRPPKTQGVRLFAWARVLGGNLVRACARIVSRSCILAVDAACRES
jgi:hypothetical protein